MSQTTEQLRDLEKEFADDLVEFYPGSSRPVVRHPNRNQKTTTVEPDKEDSWDAHPRSFRVGGKSHEFFTTGNLAQALNRRPGTIRSWEREGLLPKSIFQSPSKDPRGRRRLYTRAQVEGIIQIAMEEGLFQDQFHTPINKTAFTEKVLALFTKLGSAL